MDFMLIPSITALVYFVITLYKQVIARDRENYTRVIPLIAGLLGIVLGIVAFLASPDMMPTENIITAMLIGGSSGLAATGAHQLFKHMAPGTTKPADDSTKTNDTIKK